jgi:phosphoenolpyruvate synthase/pyruvate phosphate dikinase
MKIVIVGGVAGGASAATRLRRLDENAQIVLFERGEHISYANCGLPYYIGGTIKEREALLVQTPRAMKDKFNIDVRVQSEVTAIDRKNKTVSVTDLRTGKRYDESYDKLVLSPGASPVRPPIPGIEQEGIFTLRTVPDTDAIKEAVDKGKPSEAVVVGGGFIGLEMAENLHSRGIKVTIVEAEDQVMAPIDYEMVDSEVSGVLFTADPMTSDRFTTVIEAVRGLGEDLVSGRKNPFEWKLRGGKLQRVSDGEGEIPLKKAHLLELSEMGKHIEQAFGCEQDIEWCLNRGHSYEGGVSPYLNNGFSIVQSRPITTLYPLPQSPDGYKHCAISAGHLQMMTDTILPLGISMLQKSAFFPVMELGGRIYMDVTYDLGTKKGRRKVLSEAQIKDHLMYSALEKIMERKEYISNIPSGPSGFLAIEGIGKILVTAVRTYFHNNEADIDAYVNRQKSEVEATRRKLERLSETEALQFIMDDQKRFRKVLYDPSGTGATVMTIMIARLLDKTVEKLTGEKAITNRLAKSVRHNSSSEMGLKLCEVSDIARNYPQIVTYLEEAGEDLSLEALIKLEGGNLVADKFAEFLEEYGMHCAGELDITRERFRERPGILCTSLLNNIKNLPAGHAEISFEQGKQEAEQLSRQLVAKMEAEHGGRKARKLKKQIEKYRKFVGVREYTKYFWMAHYDVYKQAIMREVHNLVKAGVLKKPEDANYLSMDELLEAVKNGYVNQSLIDERKDAYHSYASLTPPRIIFSDGEVPPVAYSTDIPSGALAGLAVKNGYVNQSLIDERKDAYHSYASLTPPRIIFSDGEVPPVAYSTDIPSGALAGLAVSTGIVEGRARVVENLEDANVEEGDILVTTFTDPSWTPIFVSLSGLITETGGMMSHGAVIIREYGLPAVVGVVNATRLIKDGQRIRVNGTKGYVEILE